MSVIRGHVVDPEGHPVAEAAVYVVSAPTNTPDIAQLTDDQGQFATSAPVPGSYTVGARSDKWGSAQAEVEVSSEGEATIEIRFNKMEDEIK